MTDVAVLDVLLYGAPVGTLTRVGGDRSLFAFNDSYIEDDARPVLGLGFKDALGELITDFKPSQTRVLPYFANLLPEGHMRTYLAARAGVDPAREFFLLWVLGADLPGGVTIRPAGDAPWPPGAGGGDGDGRDAHDRENALRFSLAGVQLKFSALRDAHGGLTIPAKGAGGSWIVKLPWSRFAGVPENEFSMMTLARRLGIDVPAIELVDVQGIANLPDDIGALGGKALTIQRFDRLVDGTPVHMEDFAQVFGVYPEQKYDKASYRNIASVLGAEGTDADIAEFVRRLTFNMLIGNSDMHLKNWSLIYPDRRTAALSPAYDFVSTVAYIPDDKAALNVSRTKRFDQFSEDELAHLAAKARLPEKLVLETARETVERFHRLWREEKSHLPLARDVVTAVEANVAKVPLAK